MGRFPAPEVVVFLVWFGVTIAIVVNGYHHPAIALAVWIAVMYVLSGISRLIRQVRRIKQNKRRYGD